MAGGLGAGWWIKDNVIWPRPLALFGAPGGTGWLPYAAGADVPTVAVTVNGRRTRALIDSGAQYSVIDQILYGLLPEQRRPVFSIPLVAYGVGGGVQTGRGAMLDVAMAGLELPNLRAAILNLGPLASPHQGGLGAPLILGQDVLGRVILELDPRRRRFRFLPADGFAPAPDLLPVSTRKEGGALAADVTVEGAALPAIIDTGASALLSMSRDSALQVGLLDGRPQRAGSSIVLGGAVRAAIIQARTVTFADQLYRQVPVGVFDQPPLPNFPESLVGMAAFAERRAALDLGRGRLWATRAMDVRLQGRT